MFLDSDNYYLLMAMHGLAPPSGSRRIKSSKTTWKFSIDDSQSMFIIHKDTLLEYKNDLKIKAKHNIEYGLPNNIMLGAVGECLASADFYVEFDDITYTFKNIIEAVECTIKICFVFNISYQEQASSFWKLLQGLFFDMPLESPVCPDIMDHIKQLTQ